MPNIREIKNRIRTVANIQRITGTMQMIASAKLQTATRQATATKPYTRQLKRLTGNLASAVRRGMALTHPLLQRPDPPVDRELLLVLTANRGLCGGYNGHIIRIADRYIHHRLHSLVDLEVVGRKGINYYRFRGARLTKAHTEFHDFPKFDQVNALAESYIHQFTAGEYDRISVVYTKYHSRGRQTPVIETLLPMEPPQEDQTMDGACDYEFNPNPEQLLGTLLNMSFKSMLFQCFSDAIVSEQIARMLAMRTATESAKQQGRSYRRQYNRVRQTRITTQLIEIVSAAEALQSGN